MRMMEAAWWWFLLAASAPVGTLVAGAAVLVLGRRRGRSPYSRSLAALHALGLASLVVVVVSAWDGGGFAFIRADLTPLPGELRHAACLLTAPLAGLALGAAVTVAVTRPRRSVLVAVAPVALLGVVAAGLFAADRTSPVTARGGDPRGTLVANPSPPAERIIGGLNFAVDLAFARDGRLLVAQLYSNEIGILAPNTTALVPLVRLPTVDGQRTLHFEPHPEWPRVPVLFVTTDATVGKERAGRLLEVTVADAEPGALRVLLEGYATGPNHPASALAVCDDYLFLTTGDGDTAAARSETGRRAFAQNPASIEGKVLRYSLMRGAAEPAGLLWDQPPVYALGLRNLYGIACDPHGRGIIGADNGFNGHDQLRLVTARSNHEWPLNDLRASFVPPWYDSGEIAIAPTGVAARAQGGSTEMFFTAYHSNALYTLVVDAEGRSGRVTRLHRFDEPALSVELGPGGCVYVGTATAVWRVAVDGCTR